MQINSESCVYVESDDVVYGDQGYANTSQWHEAVYYGSPRDVFDNEADVSYRNGDVHTYNSTYYQDLNISDQYSYYGAPQSSSFSGGYVFDNQDLSYDYGTYHYEYCPVYYVYPTYLGNYPLTNLQYTPESFYYDYVPANLYYYVPTFIYYTPTSTYNESDITYYDHSTHYYQSHEMSVSMEQNFDASQEFYRNSSQSREMRFSMEQNFDASQEFNSNLYNFEKGSSTDSVDCCKEIVGEEITTCYLFYGEYPQTLNDAPVDDEANSVSSNENLENNVVSTEAAVNENKAVYEEPHNIKTNHCEDDVDRKLIKKISSMSIDDVKEDIDENYENAKAFVYNEVLKGYIEIKNQLEELDWECHSLEDILEEEEPESDSSEIDFNENVEEVLENINILPDEEDGSRFESVSEESEIASNEEDLVEGYQIMMEVAQPSMDPLMVEEKDKTDPLELGLSKDNLHSGYMNSIEDHRLPADSLAIDEISKMGPFLEQSLSKEELHSGPKDYQIMMEVAQQSADPLMVEEKDKTDPLELGLSEDNLHSGYMNSIEDHHLPADSLAIDEISKMGPFLEQSLSKEELQSRPEDYQIMMEVDQQFADPVAEEKDKTDPFLEPCLSKENLHSEYRNSNEEHPPPTESSAIEEISKMGPFLEESLSKKELHSGPVNSIEKHHPTADSSVVEGNQIMDPIPQLSLREHELDAQSRKSIEEVHTKMSSQDGGEEILNSDPDVLAPAASKEVQRKKRFSGLRKFLTRMCCCAKKRS